MKIKTLFLVFIAFLFYTNSVGAQKKRPTPKPSVLSAREISAKVLPSVVLIITQDSLGNPISQGSGFVYKPGYVVSNLHVFEWASKAIVKNVVTGEISKAEAVIGMSTRDDLCVIQIENFKFPALKLGDSDAVRTGDQIYVASNPKGLEGTITKGIISSVRKREGIFEPIPDSSQRNDLPNLDQFALPAMFQIDAAISPGSSGGVVVDSRGNAIGIVKSSLVSGQNLNFAIPVNKLKSLPERFNRQIRLAGAVAFTDLAKRGLHGSVSWVRELTSNIDFNTGVLSEPSLSFFGMYDEFGNETMVIFYSGGQRQLSRVFEFDENGFLESETVINRDGSKTNKTYSFEDRIQDKIFYGLFDGVYSQEGKNDRKSHFDSRGNLTKVIGANYEDVYAYDSKDRVIGRSVQDKGGQGKFQYSYREDSFGNWIEQSRYLIKRSGSGDERVLIGKTIREVTYYSSR